MHELATLASRFVTNNRSMTRALIVTDEYQLSLTQGQRTEKARENQNRHKPKTGLRQVFTNGRYMVNSQIVTDEYQLGL